MEFLSYKVALHSTLNVNFMFDFNNELLRLVEIIYYRLTTYYMCWCFAINLCSFYGSALFYKKSGTV